MWLWFDSFTCDDWIFIYFFLDWRIRAKNNFYELPKLDKQSKKAYRPYTYEIKTTRKRSLEPNFWNVAYVYISVVHICMSRTLCFIVAAGCWCWNSFFAACKHKHIQTILTAASFLFGFVHFEVKLWLCVWRRRRRLLRIFLRFRHSFAFRIVCCCFLVYFVFWHEKRLMNCRAYCRISLGLFLCCVNAFTSKREQR